MSAPKNKKRKATGKKKEEKEIQIQDWEKADQKLQKINQKNDSKWMQGSPYQKILHKSIARDFQLGTSEDDFDERRSYLYLKAIEKFFPPESKFCPNCQRPAENIYYSEEWIQMVKKPSNSWFNDQDGQKPFQCRNKHFWWPSKHHTLCTQEELRTMDAQPEIYLQKQFWGDVIDEVEKFLGKEFVQWVRFIESNHD